VALKQRLFYPFTMQHRRRRRGESYYHPVDEPFGSWVTWPRLLKTSTKAPRRRPQKLRPFDSPPQTWITWAAIVEEQRRKAKPPKRPSSPKARSKAKRTIYPWPRSCPIDGTVLGVDVSKKARDIRKIALHVVPPPEGTDPDDFIQEIALTITRRNTLANPFDPRKGSFSHYIVMVAKSVRSHVIEREKRWGRHELTPEHEFNALLDESDPIDAYLDADEFAKEPPPPLFSVRDRIDIGTVEGEARPDLQRMRSSSADRDRARRSDRGSLHHEGRPAQRASA
jgi:hypothetical protein